MMATGEAEAIREVARRNDLSVVVLFGSRATGRARSDSDLDLAVLSRDGQPMPWRRLGQLALEFEDVAGRKVDAVDLASADPLLRFEVASHGQVVLADPREAWTSLLAQTLIEHDDVAPFLEALMAGVRRAARAPR